MSRRAGKDPIDEAEQQRQRDKEEARRIETRRLEIEEQPNPPEVLQYVSHSFPTVPWSPFGFGGDPGVSHDDLRRELGSDVHINYDDMDRVESTLPTHLKNEYLVLFSYRQSQSFTLSNLDH